MLPSRAHDPQRDRWLRMETRPGLQVVARGQLAQARLELLRARAGAGLLRPRRGRRRPEEREQAPLAIADGHARRRRRARRAGRARPAARSPMPSLPVARAVLLQHSLALARDPALLPGDEVAGLAFRAPARHGDAQRAVRTDPQDVAPRAWRADELDRREGQRRQERRERRRPHSRAAASASASGRSNSGSCCGMAGRG